ncbi:MAG: YdbL family protein [Terricaulis sp.]
MKRSHAKSEVAKFVPDLLFAAFFTAATLFTMVTPAHAQQGADPVVAQARAAGQVGEQADGYVGVVTGETVSAEVRAHVEQLNIRRRTAYTSAASQANASVSDFAAATACQRFRNLSTGERYRNEAGQWASAPAQLPSFCGNH